MLKKILLITLLLFSFPVFTFAEEATAAFVRGGNLWLLQNGKEEQITKIGKVHHPQWSHDGTKLVYQREAPAQFSDTGTQNELWIYSVKTKESKRIFYDGYHPSWSPHDDRIAFQNGGVLNVYDGKEFQNVALGVDDYIWLADGSGFLLSAGASLQPDGWTNPKLYTKQLNGEKLDLFTGVTPFFTIPKDLDAGQNKLWAAFTSNFQRSPSGKWISFIASPTASLSMDSNALCVISDAAKEFQVLDEVILHIGMPKWAPHHDILAYIAGGGRIVAGFKNKALKTKEFPVSASLTPEHYADLDFTWRNEQFIITSRVKETEWSNDLSKHPLPDLYEVDIDSKAQRKVTSPPKGLGDYQPYYVQSIGKLTWFRGPEMSEKRNLWMANPDGTDAKEWLHNVEEVEFFEGKKPN